MPGHERLHRVRKARRRVFLGGPPLVKMAHRRGRRRGDARRRRHARAGLRSGRLPRRRRARCAAARPADRRATCTGASSAAVPARRRRAPAYDTEELLGVRRRGRPHAVRHPRGPRADRRRLALRGVQAAVRRQLVMRLGVARTATRSACSPTTASCSARSRRRARSSSSCATAQDTPLLFLQNITGFMVGSRYERGGIIKHGAKLINAVSNSTVPHITLMVGASYGAGNYGMAGARTTRGSSSPGRTTGSRSWARSSSPACMSIVQRQQRGASRACRSTTTPTRRCAARSRSRSSEQSSALFATGRMWDDGIIDPRDTRTVLGLALSATH